MQVGTLVRMIGDRHNVLGIITKVIEPWKRKQAPYYKVVWLDDLCDPSYCNEDNLEVICE